MDWTHTILGPDPYAGLVVVFILPVCVRLARTRAISQPSQLP